MKHVFIVTELNMRSSEPSVSTEIFTNEALAQKHFDKEVQAFRDADWGSVYRNLVEDASENRFEAFRQGYHDEFLTQITIEKKVLHES